jgi:antitoxin component YwqK of YwqJK toxin-antitoxin module
MKPLFVVCLFLMMCFSSCRENQRRDVVSINLKNEKTAFKNGILFHDNTPFSGTVIDFDAINKTSNHSFYLDGKKEGEEKKWFSNDSLAESRHYKKGLKVGVHQSWWENGNKKFVYHFNNNGAYHGSVRDWYENGNPFKYFNYKNGKESGIQKMWQSTGKIRANYSVVNGDRFGLIGLKKCATITTE